MNPENLSDRYHNYTTRLIARCLSNSLYLQQLPHHSQFVICTEYRHAVNTMVTITLIAVPCAHTHKHGHSASRNWQSLECIIPCHCTELVN
jgi:hypothetical protein